MDWIREAEALFPYTQTLRRDFHSHPELGFQEVRTAGIVARQLNELGLEVHTGIAETGVIAILEGELPGPVVLLRFDMDALPILEETQAVYASLNPGVMHACGHDGHTAIGITVAHLLHSHRDMLRGTVKFVFQPAEEGLGGAQRMVKEGVLEDPRPNSCLSLHLWNEKPVGWIGAAAGPVMAASEIFKLQLTGKGGHGAVPNLTIDPVLGASHIISALQSIVSRNVSPLQSAVISVTSVHSGEAFNVIPNQATLKGTIRTFEPVVRQLVLERFRQVVEGVALAMGCQVTIEVESITPAVINDPGVTSRVQSVVRNLVPDAQLDEQCSTMGSEDMAFMMQQIPGCYYFIGSANSDKGLNAAHHHPRFDFDEIVMPRAAAIMANAAVEMLEKS